MISGIYIILNLVNSKLYIGSTSNFKVRFRHHFHYLENNIHANPFLQNAWNKYGADVFDFIIVEEVNNLNELSKIEQKWINASNCCDRKFGYNIKPLAYSNIGFKPTIETRRKMSAAQSKRKHSEEIKLKISIANKNKPKSYEHRIKLSIANVGKKQSPETIEKAILSRRKLYMDKWPCKDGAECKCFNCSKQRSQMRRIWRKSNVGSALR